jgi:inosose dehydratase
MSVSRVAGAPISWGVSEVAGWGYQLAPERVLGEMRELGLGAAEFGPAGFLPKDPAQRAAALAGYGLAAVGGFVPVVLHVAEPDPVAAVAPVIDDFAAAGADVLVLAADAGATGYDARVELDAAQWRLLLSTLDRIAAAAAEVGLTATLHPHVGTVVERRSEVDRVLAGSSIPLCLDTGHLLVGDSDPLEVAVAAADRIGHVHLKDVDAAAAARVSAGEIAYSRAVAAGLYRPLGTGDVDVAGIVAALSGAGYTGWYVLEQDAVLAAEPPAGTGPLGDVRASLAYLRGLGV